MPNYKVQDILENPDNKMKLYGFCGKIARINLTDKTVSYVNTYKYVPEYVGGRMIINRIFWDEVPENTGGFDEANKFIFMSGATTGTGIPAGGRSAACAIGVSNTPEMFCWGNIGGWFATELKYAGYDGFIIEGKSDEPVYIKIEDDSIEILPADEMWGMRVHQSQKYLEDKYSHEFKSMVIGPAGENLVRIASITTSNDCVFAKGGFGAVWGSKKLKAITVHGTGVIAPADLEKILYLRMNMNHPYMRPSPIQHCERVGIPGADFERKYDRGNVACSPGCNQHCNELMIGCESAFGEGLVNHIEKCVGPVTFIFKNDIPTTVGQFWPTKQNYCAPCKLLSKEFPTPDFTDPDFEAQSKVIAPDLLNYWEASYDSTVLISDLCNEYGIDKWEIMVWLRTWLSMCKQEHLLDGNKLGCEHDIVLEDPEFMREFITNLVYRKGYYGNLFADGMSRAIREMGYDKYSETIYHKRFSQELGGKRIDLPVSLEGSWGQSMHWQGRGFQGALEKPTWLGMNIINMLSSRDAQTVEHFHCEFEHHDEAMKDPYHSQAVIDAVISTQNNAEIKDSVMSCEWQSPDPWWPTMEAEMYSAATGYPMTPQELSDAAYRSKLLFRAIMILYHGRTRKQEMEQIWRCISIPDSWNEVADWKLWNEFVDMYYNARGWDLQTGWPYRETYEKYGLRDVADRMEKAGFLPEHPKTVWNDYGEAPFVLFTQNRKKEPDYAD